MLKEATVEMASVEIDAFSGLLVDYARRRAGHRHRQGPAGRLRTSTTSSRWRR